MSTKLRIRILAALVMAISCASVTAAQPRAYYVDSVKQAAGDGTPG